MAARVSAPLLFGKNHPYGAPLTGTGFESTVPKGSAPRLEIPKVANADQPTIYIVDKPGAIQSVSDANADKDGWMPQHSS